MALQQDQVLRTLAETPLMLSIMSLAYQNRTVESSESAARESGSLAERRDQIFGLYVERMFQRRKSDSLVFPKDKVIGWLSWLAKTMKEHSQSVFMVEGLEPSWLASMNQRILYGAIVALPIGLIYGLSVGQGLGFGLIAGLGILLGCWSESSLKNGIFAGLIPGLSIGLSIGLREGLFAGLTLGVTFGLIAALIAGLGVGSLNRISLVEVMSWSWKQFWKNVLGGLIAGLIFGMIVDLIVIVSFSLIEALSAYRKFGLMQEGLAFVLRYFFRSFLDYIFDLTGLIDGLGLGLVAGLVFGLIRGLLGGMTGRLKGEKALPNEGIKLSGKNGTIAAVISCAIFGSIVGLIAGLTCGLSFGPSCGLSTRLSFGLAGLELGLSFGLIAGLNRGGSAAVKHYSLRLTLWLCRYTPIRFIKFLDYCSTLILLKKVGGGYIFIHRMLLEYFARAESTDLQSMNR
jgi:hypothetical protein